MRIDYDLATIRLDLKNSIFQLYLLTGIPIDQINVTKEFYDISDEEFQLLQLQEGPKWVYATQREKLGYNRFRLEKSKAYPQLFFGYQNQDSRDSDVFKRFFIGVKFPSWVFRYKANLTAAQIQYSQAINTREEAEIAIQSEFNTLIANIKTSQIILNRYNIIGKKRVQLILKTSTESLEHMESLDFLSFYVGMKEAFEVEIDYLNALYEHNSAYIKMDYLLGNK